MSRLSVPRIALLLALLALLGVVAGCDYVERVSVRPAGGDPNGVSFDPSISANGRYVVFWSSAGNLVPGDGNGVNDVFRRDLLTKTTTRVSVDAGGGDPNRESFYPSISATGRYVAFASSATDLVPGDTNPLEDIFVRDMQSGTTTRVTLDANGGDPNQGTRHARISADGRHVVFATSASDLVPNDGNGLEDVFVRDLGAGSTTRASVDTTGSDANGASGSTFLFSPPAIDADGSRVVFFSAASDLVPMDGNGFSDVFVRDLSTGDTTRVSVDAAGGDANGPSDEGNGRPGISGDGNVVAFSSFASDLAAGDGNGAGSDVFVRDLQSSTTSLMSAASSGGSGASISDDGRFVAFQTTQIWVHDRVNGTTALASARSGHPANGISGNASVSGDGRYVVFHTNADNLVAGDRNRTFDIYVRSVSMPTVTSVSPDQVGAGRSRRLIVTGSGFLPGANASTSLLTPPGVTVTSVKVRSETVLRLRVTVDGDAPLGPRNLIVWNPGTGPGAASSTFALCQDCFAVAPGPHPGDLRIE
jgi:Tol biopolymer transport system component